MKITVASMPEEKTHEKWEVEEALRTLIKAEEIRSDPELIKKVAKLAGTQKKAITSISDLKDRYASLTENPKVGQDREDDEIEESDLSKKVEKEVKEDSGT